MRSDSNSEINELKVDGGAVQNNLLCQLQSNFSKTNIIRPKVIETTALGAALAAAIGSEIIQINEIKGFWQDDQSFSPETNSYYNKKMNTWKKHQDILYLKN